MPLAPGNRVLFSLNVSVLHQELPIINTDLNGKENTELENLGSYLSHEN